MKKRIYISAYNKGNKLIGHKSDSFWTLSETRKKEHSLSEGGKIPEHLIKNLLSILNAYLFVDDEKERQNLVNSNRAYWSDKIKLTARQIGKREVVSTSFLEFNPNLYEYQEVA